MGDNETSSNLAVNPPDQRTVAVSLGTSGMTTDAYSPLPDEADKSDTHFIDAMMNAINGARCDKPNANIPSNITIAVHPDQQTENTEGGRVFTSSSTNSGLERTSRTYLMVYAFTLVHALVTRSPFTVIALYVRDDLEMSNEQAVMAMVCYSIGRALATQISSKWMTRSMMMSCCIFQIVGTVMLYLSSSIAFFREILPVSVVMMGFAEIIAGLDTLLKGSMHSWTEEKQQMLYRGKMGCIAIGAGIGFLANSYLYQHSGILGGCLFMGGAGVLHLILTVFYLNRLLGTQPLAMTSSESKKSENCSSAKARDTGTQSVVAESVEETGGMAETMKAEVDAKQHVLVYKYFTPFLLSAGAVMITTDFTVTALYWEDVWNTKPVVCGSLFFIGEIGGFLVLSILKRKCVRNRKLSKQPALIVLAAILGLFAVSPLAFGGFIANLMTGNGSWMFYVDAVGTVLISIANSMLHTSGIELMVLLLPNELFQNALTRGYVLKRFVNSLFGISFAFLFGISPHSPYQLVFAFLCLYISSMIIVFSVF